MAVSVPFPTKAAGAVGPLAGGAHRCFGIKWLYDAVRLPLHHADGQRFIDILAVFVRAGFIHCDANIRRRPWRGGVNAPHATHLASFEILLAFVAHRQTRIGKLYIERLREARRSERQYILWECSAV